MYLKTEWDWQVSSAHKIHKTSTLSYKTQLFASWWRWEKRVEFEATSWDGSCCFFNNKSFRWEEGRREEEVAVFMLPDHRCLSRALYMAKPNTANTVAPTLALNQKVEFFRSAWAMCLIWGGGEEPETDTEMVREEKESQENMFCPSQQGPKWQSKAMGAPVKTQLPEFQLQRMKTGTQWSRVKQEHELCSDIWFGGQDRSNSTAEQGEWLWKAAAWTHSKRNKNTFCLWTQHRRSLKGKN